jgi:hypothetical protein
VGWGGMEWQKADVGSSDEVVLVDGAWCPVQQADTPMSATFLTPSTPAFAFVDLGEGDKGTGVYSP